LIHTGKFADGHSTPGRQRMDADKALKARLELRTFHRDTAQRVGTIEDNRTEFEPRRGLKTEQHGRLKSVVAAAHILEVNYQGVQPAQLFFGGTQAVERGAIKAIDSQAGG